MIILVLRTDKPEAEIGLYDNDKQLEYIAWEAHRQLAETLHGKIRDMLASHGKDWDDIKGIVCFQGPGSFTGLRLGLSAANALAATLPASIVATKTDDWVRQGVELLQKGEDQKVVLPEYGAPVHITQQRK